MAKYGEPATTVTNNSYKNVQDRNPEKNLDRRSSLGKGSEGSRDSAQTQHFAPDGGYGWVIVCACFMLQMVVPGLISVFGVFLPQFLDYFGALRSKTAITGAMLSACTMIPGPLVSVLASLIGCRAVAMLGGFFITIGLLLSIFANSVEVMIVTMGLISGLGLGLIYLPLIVMVGFWFDKRRAIAMGITTSGAGIGVMCMGSLSGWLLENYDWRNALVLVAGFTLQCIVCGALLRPVTQPKNGSTVVQSEDIADVNNKELNIINDVTLSVKSLDTALGKNQLESAENQVLLTSTIPQTKWMDSSPLFIKQQPHLFKETCQSNQDVSLLQYKAMTIKGDIFNPLLRKDIFYSGSIKDISKHNNNNNNHIKQSSIMNKNYDSKISPGILYTESNLKSLDFESEQRASNCCNSSYIAPMKKMLGLNILTSVPFLLILLANSFFQTGFVICICFVTDYGLSIGLEAKTAAHMTSAFGLGTTLGRIAGGAVTLIPHIGPVLATSVSLLLAAFSSLSIVLFCDNFLSLAVCVAFTGFFLAPIIPLTAVMQVEYLGLDNLTNAHGMVSLGKGIVSLFGPPIAGLLQDWTGSATPPFYLTAAILVIASGLQASLLLCSSTEKQRNTE